MERGSSLKTIAIVPVKRFENAKQRLSTLLSPVQRAELAETMFLDTLSHVRRSKRIDDTVVVTSEPVVARTARWMGVDLLEQTHDDGHSAAASAGVKLALERGADRVALLPADCPMLDAAELDRHLGQMPRSALIVPDRHRTGTNALLLSPPDVFSPAFGPDSCARHASRARAAGVSFVIDPIASLSLDLDTPEDYVELREALLHDSSRAPRTAKLIWRFEEQAGEESATGAHATA
jgi:2-phospho-L-lactate guanylyltransferase